MTRDDVRRQLHQILDTHDQLLDALRARRQARGAMHETFETRDAALVSAIEANRAALVLLDRIEDEGVTE